jgi:hypothetical protein
VENFVSPRLEQLVGIDELEHHEVDCLATSISEWSEQR